MTRHKAYLVVVVADLYCSKSGRIGRISIQKHLLKYQSMFGKNYCNPNQKKPLEYNCCSKGVKTIGTNNCCSKWYPSPPPLIKATPPMKTKISSINSGNYRHFGLPSV